MNDRSRLHPTLTLGTIALAFTMLGIVACSGTTTGPSSTALPAMRSAQSSPKPSPTPYSFAFVTVDRAGADYNHVTGINQIGFIVGYSGSGSPSDPAKGYTSQPPYTKLRPINYPGAINSFPTSISTDRLTAGYFLAAQTGSHTFGFVKNHALYTLYKDNKTPKGPDSVNEILGIDESNVAIGFYVDSSGIDNAFELNVATDSFLSLHPTGFSSAEGTGIDGKGDLCGYGTINGTTTAWIYRNGSYHAFMYPGSVSTTATSLNWQNQVAGSYVDGYGITHGYIVTNPGDSNPYWQSIDEPQAAGVTVISGINDHHALAGWYVDSTGINHGFVATLTTTHDR